MGRRGGISSNGLRALIDECFARTVPRSAVPANPFPLAIDIRDRGAISGQDATAAIQAAVTEASSGDPSGGAVYIPPGLWPTSVPITGASGCVIYGAGRNSIVQPRFTGAAGFDFSGGSRVILETLQIDVSQGLVNDGVRIGGAQECVLSSVFIQGGHVGATRGGVSLDTGNGYNLLLHNVEVYQCSGHGLFAVPGIAQATLVVQGASHLHDNLGWGISVDTGATSGTELRLLGSTVEGNRLGEVTGCAFAWVVLGNHFESTNAGAGTSCLKVTGAQRANGALIVGNFFINSRSGAAGDYCLELNPSGGVSDGILIEGNDFDQFNESGIFVGPLVNGRIGPNHSNGTLATGTFSQSLVVEGAGQEIDQLPIIRTFALGQQACLERSGGGFQTIGATSGTFDYALTVANFGPANEFTGLIRYSVKIEGRSTTSADFFYIELAATFSMRAGVPTLGASGVTTVASDHLGGGSAGSATLTISGANARVTATGWTDVTVDWGIIYEAVGRP